MVAPLLVGREREAVLRAEDAVDEVVGGCACHARVRRREREPELLDEPEVRGVRGADELAAELHRATVDVDLLDATADPLASLEHDDVGAAVGQVARRRQAGQAGPEDDDVGHAPVPSAFVARTRSASGGRCAETRSPRPNGGSAPVFASSAWRVAPLAVRTITCVVEPR